MQQQKRLAGPSGFEVNLYTVERSTLPGGWSCEGLLLFVVPPKQNRRHVRVGGLYTPNSPSLSQSF